jgi:hypothetical protein
LLNEKKTNDYENFEKGMIYMKILKKGGGVVEKRGEEETKSMLHAPVNTEWYCSFRISAFCFVSSIRMPSFLTGETPVLSFLVFLM